MGANNEQGQFWGGTGGSAWVDLQEQMDGQLAPLGEALLDAVRPVSGERALDVGCGCGSTTLAIARLVGASGSAVGCDISDPMLARAKQRAAEAALVNTTFTVADVQTASLGGPFDLVSSRFGVMFFDDPVAAFSNMRRATRTGGRLAFVCWQHVSRNDSFSVVGAAANEVLGRPDAVDPAAPGPFAFADKERVERIVADAGWVAVNVEECIRPMQVFGTHDLDQAVNGAMRIGGVARRLIDQPADVAARVRSAVRATLAQRWTPTGWTCDGVCWLVTAHN